MTTYSHRVLVVDDFAEWRTFVRTKLQNVPGLRIISEVSDGIDAVGQVQELQPDLVVLDIGLPKLNGIEAARRIRDSVPNSRVLFFSEIRAWDVVEEALRSGLGYLVSFVPS